MPTVQGPELHLGHVWTTGGWARRAPGLVYTTRAGTAPGHIKTSAQWPGLHLDVSRLHEPVLLLDVSTIQWSVMQESELHLDAPGQQEPVLLLNVKGSLTRDFQLQVFCQ